MSTIDLSFLISRPQQVLINGPSRSIAHGKDNFNRLDNILGSDPASQIFQYSPFRPPNQVLTCGLILCPLLGHKHGSQLVSGLLRWYGVLENTASLSTAWNFSPNVVIRKYYIPCLSETSVSSAAQSCLTLCDPMDCSTPGFPVHHQLPEFTQTHVH